MHTRGDEIWLVILKWNVWPPFEQIAIVHALAKKRSNGRIVRELLYFSAVRTFECQSRAALLAERPDAAAMIKYPASDTYLRNVAALNLPALWAAIDLPVLVVYGSADFITSEADSRAILEDVNRAHP